MLLWEILPRVLYVLCQEDNKYNLLDCYCYISLFIFYDLGNEYVEGKKSSMTFYNSLHLH